MRCPQLFMFFDGLSLWKIWLLGYVFACVVAIVLQTLVLPSVPTLHAGQGLMNQDAILFHKIASKMAEQINAFGWSNWKLMPANGITANVGILAAVYAVFGADPIWFVPVNAAFHALGAVLVLRIGMCLLPGCAGRIAGAITGLLFLVFPSALVWYGQNHKDSFLISGYLLALLAFVRALRPAPLWEMLLPSILMVAGCILVAVMRPYMLTIYAVAFVFVLFILTFFKLIRPTWIQWNVIRNGLLIVALMVVATIGVPKILNLGNSEFGTSEFGASEIGSAESRALGWRWTNSGFIPEFIDNKLAQVSFVRAHFISYGTLVEAGSTLDGHIVPGNVKDMMKYLPRAMWVALFAPFPESWFERPTVPRLVGAIETLIFYLMVPGVIVIAFLRPSVSLFACLAVSALVLTVLAYTSPNVGNLHRVRYGPLFVFMLAGASGWVLLLSKLGISRSEVS